MNLLALQSPTDENPSAHLADLDDAWLRCGYQPLGRGRYRRGECLVAVGRSWLTVSAPAQADRPQLGSTGCWKSDGPRHDLFHLPVGVLGWSNQEHGNPAADPLFSVETSPGESTFGEALAQWTWWWETSRRGDLPDGWTPPALAELRQGIDPMAWSLPVGSHLLGIELELNPRQLALRAILASAAEPLSAARQQWLAEKVATENRHWHWVRLGLAGPADRPQVVAEIDLSGCPRGWLSELIWPALWALRLVAEQVLPTAALLTNSRVCCESWEQSWTEFAASRVLEKGEMP